MSCLRASSSSGVQAPLLASSDAPRLLRAAGCDMGGQLNPSLLVGSPS